MAKRGIYIHSSTHNHNSQQLTLFYFLLVVILGIDISLIPRRTTNLIERVQESFSMLSDMATDAGKCTVFILCITLYYVKYIRL